MDFVSNTFAPEEKCYQTCSAFSFRISELDCVTWSHKNQIEDGWPTEKSQNPTLLSPSLWLSTSLLVCRFEFVYRVHVTSSSFLSFTDKEKKIIFFLWPSSHSRLIHIILWLLMYPFVFCSFAILYVLAQHVPFPSDSSYFILFSMSELLSWDLRVVRVCLVRND